MRSRDDEIRLLELQIQEDKREIALFKKKLPAKRALDQELELYRICVSWSERSFESVRLDSLIIKYFMNLFSSSHVKNV